jgi:hypothetical protein
MPKRKRPADELATAWVSAKTAADVASTYERKIRELAARGEIRVRKLPGCHPRYALADVLKLVEQSKRPAPAGVAQ